MELTLDLVRKRSEHHDGALSELEEVSLACCDLVTLGGALLPRHCRSLRILYAQSNALDDAALAPLARLRALEYANVALNCARRVPAGLAGASRAAARGPRRRSRRRRAPAHAATPAPAQAASRCASWTSR